MLEIAIMLILEAQQMTIIHHFTNARNNTLQIYSIEILSASFIEKYFIITNTPFR